MRVLFVTLCITIGTGARAEAPMPIDKDVYVKIEKLARTAVEEKQVHLEKIDFGVAGNMMFVRLPGNLIKHAKEDKCSQLFDYLVEMENVKRTPYPGTKEKDWATAVG